jgi:hypothetical protein
MVLLCRFVNGTGHEVWAEPFLTVPTDNSTSLPIWVAEIHKMFPTYNYGVNLFIMAYGEQQLQLRHLAGTEHLQLAAATASIHVHCVMNPVTYVTSRMIRA